MFRQQILGFKKTLLVAFAFLGLSFFSSTGMAGEKIEVSVNGMVCTLCAQGIAKKLGETSQIESFNVDMDNKLVSLVLKDGQTLEDERIRQMITEAGYDVVSIARSEETDS